jgi:hypothetical protein
VTIPPEHQEMNDALRRAAFGSDLREPEPEPKPNGPRDGRLAGGPPEPPPVDHPPEARLREAFLALKRQRGGI